MPRVFRDTQPSSYRPWKASFVFLCPWLACAFHAQSTSGILGALTGGSGVHARTLDTQCLRHLRDAKPVSCRRCRFFLLDYGWFVAFVDAKEFFRVVTGVAGNRQAKAFGRPHVQLQLAGGQCPFCAGRAWTCLLTRPSSSTTGAVVQKVVPRLQFTDSLVDFPCRGAETYPHGPCEIPSCRTYDCRCPCCADAGALGPDSIGHCLEVRRCSSARWDVAVFLQRQFQLSPLTVGSASVSFITMVVESEEGFWQLFVVAVGLKGFLGPCTQVQGRGPCPQGHGSHN